MKGRAVRCTQKQDCMSVSYSEFFCFFSLGNSRFKIETRVRTYPDFSVTSDNIFCGYLSLQANVAQCCPYTRNSNITIPILNIIHRPVFYLKLDVSETGFCFRPQVDSIDRSGLCLQTPAKSQKPKSNLYYERRSVGQSVFVSGTRDQFSPFSL
jgi:hypothetical protein